MDNDTPPSRLSAITDLLRALLWPVAVILIVILFYNPIKNLITNSDSITIGSLTLKLKDEIDDPKPEVKKVISRLSEKDISEILYLGNDIETNNFYDKNSLEESPIPELIDLGIVKAAPRPLNELSVDSTHKNFKVTPLGADTYNFLNKLITAFAKKISSDKTDKK
jgi:hypothetical protein